MRLGQYDCCGFCDGGRKGFGAGIRVCHRHGIRASRKPRTILRGGAARPGIGVSARTA